MNIFSDRIFTPRLVLKRIEREDLELLVKWCNEPQAYGSYLTPERFSLMQLHDQWTSGALWSERNKILLIQLRDGAAIGTIHYWLRSKLSDVALIAVKIAYPEHRTKGYGTESQKYIIKFLFNQMNLRSIEMYTDINNLIQQRCLKKLCFELVDSLNYDDYGVVRTGHLYRLDRDRYLQELFYYYA